MTPASARPRPNLASRRGAGMPRALPWESPISRLWPGTKLLCLTALTTLLVTRPRWLVIGVVAAVYLVVALLARVPRSAVPRVPMLVLSMFIGGFIGSAMGGDIMVYLRFTALGVVVLLGTALLLWTTRPAQLVPAFATLLRPLRLLRVPTDEWAATMALCLRGIPVLTDEVGAVADASRLRVGWQQRLRAAPEQTGGWARTRASYAEGLDILIAAVSASARRAAATGRAMTLRGGVPAVPRERVRLGWGDLVAFAGTAAVVAGALIALR
ncbi:MAG: hypothetical protein LWW86_01460 [Micrococcales bacterium]|nr:hypothetical protein [Micrococcales bacterium]